MSSVHSFSLWQNSIRCFNELQVLHSHSNSRLRKGTLEIQFTVGGWLISRHSQLKIVSIVSFSFSLYSSLLNNTTGLSQSLSFNENINEIIVVYRPTQIDTMVFSLTTFSKHFRFLIQNSAPFFSCSQVHGFPINYQCAFPVDVTQIYWLDMLYLLVHWVLLLYYRGIWSLSLVSQLIMLSKLFRSQQLGS